MEPTHKIFELEFSLTAQEFWDFQQIMMKKVAPLSLGPRIRNLLFWLFVVFFLSLYSTMSGEGSTDPLIGKEILIGGVAALAVGLCLFWWLGIYQKSWMRENCTPLPNGFILGERQMKITPTGITEEAKHSKSHIAWPGVLEIIEESTVIALKVDTSVAFLIPTRIFAEKNEKQDFLNTIRMLWNQKPRT